MKGIYKLSKFSIVLLFFFVAKKNRKLRPYQDY